MPGRTTSDPHPWRKEQTHRKKERKKERGVLEKEADAKKKNEFQEWKERDSGYDARGVIIALISFFPFSPPHPSHESVYHISARLLGHPVF